MPRSTLEIHGRGFRLVVEGQTRQAMMVQAMFDRSLMERLETTASGDSSQQQGSFDRFRASVVENLRRVLNAHQGCCETRPDLGMPDLTNAIGQGADAVRAIAHSLTQQIEMFEP